MDAQVARMVGIETIVPARITSVHEGLATLTVEGGGKVQLIAVAPPTTNNDVLICIRGEDVVIQTGETEHTSSRNRLKCRVLSLDAEGPIVRVSLQCGEDSGKGFPLTAIVTKPAAEELVLRENDIVTAVIKAPVIHVITRS